MKNVKIKTEVVIREHQTGTMEMVSFSIGSHHLADVTYDKRVNPPWCVRCGNNDGWKVKSLRFKTKSEAVDHVIGIVSPNFKMTVVECKKIYANFHEAKVGEVSYSECDIYEVGKEGVVEIRLSGDKHYTVVFDNGGFTEIYNPNTVEFKPVEEVES